jgi:tetratricopeptide (TPR) repeat protein
MVYNDIGCAYIMLQEYDNAIDYLEKSIECSYAQYADAYYNLGYSYFLKENSELATLYYNKACKLNQKQNFTYYE